MEKLLFNLAPHGGKAPVSPHFAPLLEKVDFLKVDRCPFCESNTRPFVYKTNALTI